MRLWRAGVLLAVVCAANASAHRLDEYLQATLLGVTRDGVDVELQLTPGVAVFSQVQAVVDRNLDGTVSPEEEVAYAKWVAGDLELRIDGRKVPLRVVSREFSSLQEMRDGLGSIRLVLRAEGSGRELRFENRHLREISAYLVNCLATPISGLTVGRQVRDEAQRSIAFGYSFAGQERQPSLAITLVASAVALMGLGGWMYRRKAQG